MTEVEIVFMDDDTLTPEEREAERGGPAEGQE